MAVKKEAVEEVKNSEALNETDIKSQVAEIMEEAKRQAEEIISKAKASVAATETEANGKMTPAQKDYYEEYVEVKLFKDNGKYSDDVFVAVNGENCRIQRGKTVRIKRKFALALENSAIQDEYAAQYSDGLNNEYREREERLS